MRLRKTLTTTAATLALAIGAGTFAIGPANAQTGGSGDTAGQILSVLQSWDEALASLLDDAGDPTQDDDDEDDYEDDEDEDEDDQSSSEDGDRSDDDDYEDEDEDDEDHEDDEDEDEDDDSDDDSDDDDDD